MTENVIIFDSNVSKMNTNAESVQDIFDGRVALKLSLGAFELDGEVAFASEKTNESLTSSLTVIAKMDNGKIQVLPSAELALNSLGKASRSDRDVFFLL